MVRFHNTACEIQGPYKLIAIVLEKLEVPDFWALRIVFRTLRPDLGVQMSPHQKHFISLCELPYRKKERTKNCQHSSNIDQELGLMIRNIIFLVYTRLLSSTI
jgi:hypothetical protein